jgi:hypothetical protein
MARFHLRTRAKPNEVSVAIGGSGTTATVLPPEHARGSIVDLRDFRLPAAFQYASVMADQLGAEIAVIEGGDTVFFIEEPPEGLVFDPASDNSHN